VQFVSKKSIGRFRPGITRKAAITNLASSQKHGVKDGNGLRDPRASLELPADASATKVSKPVLFVLKMTEFR
jgi:hypothetical protein